MTELRRGVQKLAIACGLVQGLFTGALQADDLSSAYVPVGPDRLSDAEFQDAVMCGAKPGAACASDPVKWSPSDAKELGLRIVAMNNDTKAVARFQQEIAAAIAEVNSVTPNLRLHSDDQASDADAEITLILADLVAGDVISGTGTTLDGVTIEGAAVTVSWDQMRHLTSATIVFASDLLPSEEQSIVLEEIVQALGPINDILGAYYTDRSIFSEDGNLLTVLGEQDRTLLLQVYGSR